MFITIGDYSIPGCSILFIRKNEIINPDLEVEENTIQYEIRFINGEKLFFLKGEETKLLEKKLEEKEEYKD